MAAELAMSRISRVDSGLMDDDVSESEPSKDSITMTHTMTMTLTNVNNANLPNEAISGNPKNWKWDTVQKWLTQKGLSAMIPVFKEGSTEKDGTDGEELLGVTLTALMDDAGYYKAGDKLNLSSVDEAEQSPLIEKFLREQTKLQLKANEEISANFTEKEATVNDMLEMKRRINLFIEKWDRILWIESYLETTNGVMPTDYTISEELGISLNVARVYLHYYGTKERTKQKDVDELLLDFNVYNDCVIWWFVIILILTNTQTKSIWIIFNKVAELTPGNVAIELLDRYKHELTRFPAERLDEVAQNVVIGSQYPICAALRLSKWFIDIASYDVAREKIFEAISEGFVDAAFDYLDLIESDHMATIVLEVRSDIEGMNAIEMGLEFQLNKFVTNQRIERITTSVMNDFEFLRPVNKDEAFEIDPLSVQLVWRKMWYRQFYFTPLGTYVTEIFLYFVYLSLFTYLSVQKFRVYDKMSSSEIIFWIFNAGYVTNELQSVMTSGLKQYFGDVQNYFDTVISGIFVASIIIRLAAIIKGPGCGHGNLIHDEATGISQPCWAQSKLNTTFVVLWGLATMTLWLRIINFCALSHSLGPMVAMIFRMMGDIATFFTIMLILFVAFAMCLMFTLGDVLPDQFGNPASAAISLFLGLLGEVDFDSLEEAGEVISPGIFYFAYAVQLLYLVIGSLVLLNLLIAMMAKTFDTIEEDTISAIIFARYQLALDRDTSPCFMLPPLNVPAMAFMVVFYLIEGIINLFKRLMHCCCSLRGEVFMPFDFAVMLMPQFMKARKLELDEQILFENCNRFFLITTNRGPTKCKFLRYKPEIGDHYVRFYTEKGKGMKVSVMNSVEKKHQWQVDLYTLHKEGLVDLEQFDNIPVTAEFTHKAHQAMNEAERSDHKSPYWICGYCRGYVKGSKISLNRLGYDMNVSDLEMKIIKKVSPDICPNCYRVRLERKRWELIWEIISIRLYYYIVGPILTFLLFIYIGFGLLKDPSELGRAVDLVKSKIMSTKEEAEELMLDAVDTVTGDGDGDGDDDDARKKSKYLSDPRYVRFHYADTQLISNLNELDTEDKGFFDSGVRDEVWGMLTSAKDDIDVFLLREKINSHIMNLSFEDELTPPEFFDNYINSYGLRKEGGDFLWAEYFEPLAMTLFERVQRLRDAFVPLPIFGRYPFDFNLLLDDMTEYFDRKPDFNKQLKDLETDEILEVLNILQPLKCSSAAQRKALLNSIQFEKDEVWEADDDDSPFGKFSRYMKEVQSLFQDTRTIKNMIRDVSTAIVERGAAASVFLDQIHFLFEDIRNVPLATPFFNSMRTEQKRGESKVELWTIRNTLFSLYFLNQVVRRTILRQNARVYVKRQQILDMVYKQFEHEIIDPEGITNLIFTANDNDPAPQRLVASDVSDEDDDEDGAVSVMDGDDTKSVMSEQDFEIDLDEEKERESQQEAQRYSWAQKSTVAIGANFEEYDSSDEEQEDAKTKITVQRLELFHKSSITASAVRDEVTSIVNNIRKSRKQKITETTVDYYRRNGLRHVRLLQDDECLRFVFEQLSRFATFYPAKMKEKCTFPMLRAILGELYQFGHDYEIDDEMVPKLVRAGNYKYVQQLHDHLYDIYHDTLKNKFSSIIIEQSLEHMSMEDVLSIVMLYERMFSTVNTKIVENGDMFVATHDVFCKFVDSKGFDPDKEKHEWTNKTQAASTLFQSVLDEQQNFVTLGQVRQTIEKMMHDIAAMKCGELTRIMNHLQSRFRNDNVRCQRDRQVYLRWMMENKGGDDFTQQLTIHSGDDGDMHTSSNVGGGKNKQMRNPGLSFKHISKNKWTGFLDDIADHFQMNVRSQTVSMQLKKDDHKDEQVAKEEEEEKKDDGDEEETLVVVGDKKQKPQKTKQIIESILENTAFDIQRRAPSVKDEIYTIDEERSIPIQPGEEEKEKEEKEKKRRKPSNVQKKRAEVFDTVLSFCSGRITLQQLFSFSKQFRKYLKDIPMVDDMMKKFDSIALVDASQAKSLESQMKHHRIPAKLHDFKTQYFAGSSEVWDAEIHWLFEGCENEYDLCYKMYPFWSASIIKDIYNFMESTEQIQGDYELKLAEFGQLKHSLNVNDELAVKLFHIIRFKVRTLTWGQIYNYFKFLLKMKYNVNTAILKSKQAGDTTMSMDGMKLAMKIQLNDESKWFFNKVDVMHGSKVTWKQIRKYLKKVISVRADMRDFFIDNRRDRQFEDEKAGLIHSISENVESSQLKMERDQEIVLRQMNELKSTMMKQILDIKRSLFKSMGSPAPRLKNVQLRLMNRSSSDGLKHVASRSHDDLTNLGNSGIKVPKSKLGSLPENQHLTPDPDAYEPSPQMNASQLGGMKSMSVAQSTPL